MKYLITSIALIASAAFSTIASSATVTCDKLVVGDFEYSHVLFTLTGIGTEEVTMSASSAEVTHEAQYSLMQAEARTRTVEEPGGITREETYYVWVPVTETRTILKSISAENAYVAYHRSDANEVMSSRVRSLDVEYQVFFEHSLHSNIIKVYTFGADTKVYSQTCRYNDAN